MEITHEMITQQDIKQTKDFEMLEYEALKYSGLSIPNEIASFDVKIANDSWLHQIRCGFAMKKHIVLLHGYGGTGMTFIRLFKSLAEHYQVHALDFLGMGLSHRKDFNHEGSLQEVLSYYVEAIELWRKAMKIDQITLAGHSFGGYLASCYARTYPNRVNRLILISPPGVHYMDEVISQRMEEEMRANASCGRKLFFSLAKYFVSRGSTPSSLMTTFWLGNIFMNRILTGRLGLENQQKQAWKQYMRAIASIQPNSERSFFKIFYFPKLGCKQPIQKMFEENKYLFPTQFYYGSQDWMSQDAARSLAMKKPKGNRISFTTVSNAGHQIIFDNPEEMAGYIINQ